MGLCKRLAASGTSGDIRALAHAWFCAGSTLPHSQTLISSTYPPQVERGGQREALANLQPRGCGVHPTVLRAPGY